MRFEDYWNAEPDSFLPEFVPAPEPAPVAPAPAPAPSGIASLPTTSAAPAAPTIPTYNVPDWARQFVGNGPMTSGIPGARLIDNEGTDVSGTAVMPLSWNIDLSTLPGFAESGLGVAPGDADFPRGGGYRGMDEGPTVNTAQLSDWLLKQGLSLQEAWRPGGVLRWVQDAQGNAVYGAPVETSTDDSAFWNAAMLGAGLITGGAATAAGMAPAATGAITGGVTGFGNTGTLRGALTGAATGAIGAGAGSFLPSDITGTGNSVLNSAANNALTQGAIATARGQDINDVLRAAGSGAVLGGINAGVKEMLPSEYAGLTRPISGVLGDLALGNPINYGALAQGLISYAGSGRNPATHTLTSDLEYVNANDLIRPNIESDFQPMDMFSVPDAAQFTPMSEEDAFQQFMDQYNYTPYTGFESYSPEVQQVEVTGTRPQYYGPEGPETLPEQVEIIGKRPPRTQAPELENTPQLPPFTYQSPEVPSFTPVSPLPSAPSPKPSSPVPVPAPAPTQNKSGLDTAGLFGILGAMQQPQTQLQDIIYRPNQRLVIPGSTTSGSLPYAYDGGLVDYLNKKG